QEWSIHPIFKRYTNDQPISGLDGQVGSVRREDWGYYTKTRPPIKGVDRLKRTIMRIGMKTCLACWTVSLSVSAFAVAADDLRLPNAVKNHERETVRALLAQHVDVNASEPDG